MGWPVFAENRRWRENREIDLFAKWPFSRLFARFFGHPSWKPFFLDSGLLSCGNTAVGGHTRNATKQGNSERFRVSVPLRALLACRKGLILRTRLEDNFSACYYLYGSMFEILSTLGFKGQKTLGAAEPSSFWKGHFSQCVRCARKFGARGVLLGLGQRRIARVFLGSWPSTLLSFLGCLGLFTKALFFPWKWVILVHFSVSPFRVSFSFSLVSFTSLCHSLFLFFLVFFPPLPCCLVFIFLPCIFAVISCRVSSLLSLLFHAKTTSKYYIWKLPFHKLLLFIFLVCLSNMFLSLLFHYIACVFWWTSMFSIFPRRPFLKHQFWFCTLWKVIVFFRAHLDWEILVDVQETLQKLVSQHIVQDQNPWNKYHFEGCFSDARLAIGHLACGMEKWW